MMNSVYVLTSKVVGQRKELATIADNVANANSTGFKRLVTDYKTVDPSKHGNKIGDFAEAMPSRIDFSAGAYDHTGNALDVALQGENSFFAVEVNGVTQYTRNGRMVIDSEGQLRTSAGHPVLDANNAPINIPADAKSISIADDGNISTEQGLAGKIGAFVFSREDLARLVRTGNGNYLAGGGIPLPAEDGDFAVLQGHLEASNVNSINEITRLTELNRAYQSALKASQQIEELNTRAIRSLSQLPN
jgi:flagellar basal-body rod protein FlgF